MAKLDIYDQGALSAGYSSAQLGDGRDWQPMSSAPRDGTWVELKCSYGVAPWYCVARWTNEDIAIGRDGPVKITNAEPAWREPEGGGPFSEGSLEWRPYRGEPEEYSDPTGGLQNSMAYWRGAVAAKHGLPADAFEEITARNERASLKQGADGKSLTPADDADNLVNKFTIPLVAAILIGGLLMWAFH